MASKSFRRKLKKLTVGFRYYRLWGTPLDPENLSYHQPPKDKNTVVFCHPLYGWITLYVLESTVPQRPYSVLNGSLDGRFFRKESAARRILNDYAELRTSKGLQGLCEYHWSLNQLNRILESMALEESLD